jgi:hypothetical protein
MKSNTRARWARLCARSEIPLGTKGLAAELALQGSNELTEELILKAWHFDELFPGEPTDDLNSDNDDALFDIEHGHDDLQEIDLNVINDR